MADLEAKDRTLLHSYVFEFSQGCWRHQTHSLTQKYRDRDESPFESRGGLRPRKLKQSVLIPGFLGNSQRLCRPGVQSGDRPVLGPGPATPHRGRDEARGSHLVLRAQSSIKPMNRDAQQTRLGIGTASTAQPLVSP